MVTEGLDGISAYHYYMPEAITFLSEYVARLYKAGYTTRELQLRKNGSFKEDLKHGVRWRIFEPYARRTIAKLDYADPDKFIHYGPDTCPKAKAYLEKLIEARQPLKKSLKKLLSLLHHYGPEAFVDALNHAADHRAYAASYIENILLQTMKPRHQHPPVTLNDPRLNLIRLQRPSLAEYDAHILKKKG